MRIFSGQNNKRRNNFGCIEVTQTEVIPISDARGIEKYKRLLLGQFIKTHFMKMFDKVDLLGELIF